MVSLFCSTSYILLLGLFFFPSCLPDESAGVEEPVAEILMLFVVPVLDDVAVSLFHDNLQLYMGRHDAETMLQRLHSRLFSDSPALSDGGIANVLNLGRDEETFRAAMKVINEGISLCP